MNPFRIAWLRHFVYALVALALMLCLAEVGLRVYDSATGQVTRRELYDRGLTCKSWVVHHTLRPNQAFLVKHPDGEGKTRIVVNSFGLRGPEPTIPKAVGTFRILCLGDDRTFGRHVAEERTSVRLIADRLRGQIPFPVETINAGVPDYCPLLSYLQLRQPTAVPAARHDPVAVGYDRCRRRPFVSQAPRDVDRQHSVVVWSSRPPVSQTRRFGGRRTVVVAGRLEAERRRSVRRCGDGRRNSGDRLAPRPLCPGSRIIPPTGRPTSPGPRTGGRDGTTGRGAVYDSFVLVVVPAPWQVSRDACADEVCREREGIGANAYFASTKPNDTLAEFCERRKIRSLDLTDLMRRQENASALFLRSSPDLFRTGA